jgi:hypothetical protein
MCCCVKQTAFEGGIASENQLSGSVAIALGRYPNLVFSYLLDASKAADMI